MEFVHLSIQEGLAEVRLERGKVNAIDDRVVDELSVTLRELADDVRVRAAILTGTGKFFSFGFDIPKFLGYSKEAFAEYLGRFTGLCRELYAHPKPVIAALNGHAVAGGCMLAIACDARIMTAGKAKVGLNEIGFGSSVFAGSVAILTSLVGARRAQEILYGGKLYSVEEAQALGLVDAVVPEDRLVEAARDLALGLGAQTPAAFRSIKEHLRRPVIDDICAREAQSIREFVEIWYSEPTWKQLQKIEIR